MCSEHICHKVGDTKRLSFPLLRHFTSLSQLRSSLSAAVCRNQALHACWLNSHTHTCMAAERNTSISWACKESNYLVLKFWTMVISWAIIMLRRGLGILPSRRSLFKTLKWNVAQSTFFNLSVFATNNILNWMSFSSSRNSFWKMSTTFSKKSFLFFIFLEATGLQSCDWKGDLHWWLMQAWLLVDLIQSSAGAHRSIVWYLWVPLSHSLIAGASVNKHMQRGIFVHLFPFRRKTMQLDCSELAREIEKRSQRICVYFEAGAWFDMFFWSSPLHFTALAPLQIWHCPNPLLLKEQSPFAFAHAVSFCFKFLGYFQSVRLSVSSLVTAGIHALLSNH